MEKTITKLKQLARESWGGKIGEERATRLEKFLRKMLKNYSEILGVSEKKLLESIEKRRNYCANNFYQEANFPKLDKDVEIFKTKEEFMKKFPSGKFICPMCEGISTDPTVCDSMKKMKSGKVCDWKAYGLMGTIGKGYSCIIKERFLEHPVVHNIFMPLELKDRFDDLNKSKIGKNK